jgi:hypothetical protein
MWMYPGPICPDRPFSTELRDAEINTRIQGVLANGVDMNFGSGPDHYCLLVSISASQHMRILTQGLGHARSAPRGVTLPKDAVRWEANHTHNEWLLVQRQRRQAWSATRAAARVRGVDTPSDLESLGGDDEEEDEDEEEGDVTPPPNSPPPKSSPCLATSSASKWGSSLVHVSQNGPGRRLGHRPIRRHSLASHWYLLTYRCSVLRRW